MDSCCYCLSFGLLVVKVFASLSQKNSNHRTIPPPSFAYHAKYLWTSSESCQSWPCRQLGLCCLSRFVKTLFVLMMRNDRPGCRNRLFLRHSICFSTNGKPSFPSSTASSKRRRRHFGKPDSKCVSPGKSLPSALLQRRLRQRRLSFPQCLQTLSH